MAAGARQSGGLPCLLDAPALRRKRDSSHQGPAIRDDRRAVLEDDEMSGDPLRILAAAGKRPAPGNPVAVIDRLGPAGRRTHPDHHHIGSRHEDLVEDGPRRPRKEHLRCRADHGHPADRTIRGGQGLDQGQDLRHAQLQPAMAARQQGSEQAHTPQPVDDVGRNAAGTLDLRGASGKLRRQVIDGGAQPRGSARNGLLLHGRVGALICALACKLDIGRGH